MQHNSKAHRHTCGPTSHLWSHITLVVPHHTCGPTSHLWSHITTLVVPHHHTCGPTSHLWSHITTLVVPYHHTCGPSTKGDWRWTPGDRESGLPWTSAMVHLLSRRLPHFVVAKWDCVKRHPPFVSSASVLRFSLVPPPPPPPPPSQLLWCPPLWYYVARISLVRLMWARVNKVGLTWPRSNCDVLVW